MRVKLDEALERGWIDQQAAKALRQQAAKSRGVGPVRPRKAHADPQALLFAALSKRFGDRAVSEFRGAVKGRGFRIDVAFPADRLAVECDGFQFHRSLSAFKADRERQNLLVCAGWRVLRYYPKEIFGSMDQIIAQIEGALACAPAVGTQGASRE